MSLLVRRLLTLTEMIALVLGTGAAPIPAMPMPPMDMAKTGHCPLCPDPTGAPVKGLPCAAFVCVGAVAAVLPTPQANSADLFVTSAAYSASPDLRLTGRNLRPDPLPPRPSVQN
jgi:hypothetical protein